MAYLAQANSPWKNGRVSLTLLSWLNGVDTVAAAKWSSSQRPIDTVFWAPFFSAESIWVRLKAETFANDHQNLTLSLAKNALFEMFPRLRTNLHTMNEKRRNCRLALTYPWILYCQCATEATPIPLLCLMRTVNFLLRFVLGRFAGHWVFKGHNWQPKQSFTLMNVKLFRALYFSSWFDDLVGEVNSISWFYLCRCRQPARHATFAMDVRLSWACMKIKNNLSHS